MSRFFLATCVGAAGVVAGQPTTPTPIEPIPPTPLEQLAQALQPLLDEVALKYHCSMSASVKLPKLPPVTVFAGHQDRDGPGIYAWGSVTKMWTGAAVLRLAERGIIDLDSSAAKYIDPILARSAKLDATQGFGSLRELFGDEVSGVTVRHLATMMSGIPDFDTAKPFPLPLDSFRRTIYANPTEDFTPVKLLQLKWVQKGKLDFAPGARTSYSSTNFVLLGLLLANMDNKTTWDAFDQGSFIPDSVRQRLSHGLNWATHNSPAELGVVRGFDVTHYNGEEPGRTGGIDVSLRHGVFAGWSASDFVGTSADVAELGHALYGRDQEIVSKKFVDQMIPTEDFYGLATFNLTHLSPTDERDEHPRAYGHLGATYGYDSIFMYRPDLDFGFAAGSNIETDRQGQPAEAACLLVNRVVNWLRNEPVQTCTFHKVGYYGGSCKCRSPKATDSLIV